MSKKPGHRKILKERMTILLVFFFCILISSSEYILEEGPGSVKTEQQETQDDRPTEDETFIKAAVDAVVPFFFASVDHAFHLIYEIEGHEPVLFSKGTHPVKYANHFSEILLERIISTNAP